jgi:hypothetical protein
MLFPPTDAEEQARVRARISMIHNPDNPTAALVGRTVESAAGRSASSRPSPTFTGLRTSSWQGV